ncbi:helix-turn-helix domain-containing protein [Geosporobacter ferrireducens]|uniref:helix-turn-helix domain-containing protein n=1 Tax=Geosporobacter ferrireducens TaxID=1424294 RepID=UPI0009F198BC|nr:helix-turn-helix domain-containing protein [Geosporobacter ferrireducens]
MTKQETQKDSHLTLDDRIIIEESLNNNYKLKDIADRLKKDPTTVSKEVKRNRSVTTRKDHSGPIACAKRKECTKKHLYSDSCNRLCKKCTTVNCYRGCPEYVPKTCSRQRRFPYVCNGCDTKVGCRLEKIQYRATVAHANYEYVLSSSREGINMTSKQHEHLDQLISPLIMKGQSIAHIYAHHKEEISCCERSLYTYFDKCVFTARNIDLPRKVRYKPRKKARSTKKNSKYRLGRTYDDFKAYLEENPGVPVVEMDTFHGRKGGKILLMLFFRNSSLVVALLLDTCTQACVIDALNKLYETVGQDVFRSSFPVILTDNGTEFQDPEAIEYD